MCSQMGHIITTNLHNMNGSILICSLLVVLVAIGGSRAENQLLRWGSKLLNETLVYEEQVQANGIWLVERDIDVYYPPKVSDRVWQ